MRPYSERSLDDQRRDAWMAAKLAVRSYAREPSDINAGKVKVAWRRVREVVSKAVDQRLEIEMLDVHRRRQRR